MIRYEVNPLIINKLTYFTCDKLIFVRYISPLLMRYDQNDTLDISIVR